MNSLILVADYDNTEYQGGAEMVDNNIRTGLSIPFLHSRSFGSVDPQAHYLITNATFLPAPIKYELMQKGNYSIFEHDYKIHSSRQPHLFPNCIIPKHQQINLDYYRNAKVVFVQTKDHLDCFKANQVEANFINLSTSIWSDEELDALSYHEKESTHERWDHRFAIIENNTYKGMQNAINWCKANTLDYVVIPKMGQYYFYERLSKYTVLVYMPDVKESFCRLVVEARCMDMNVIAPKTFGAVKEPWFSMHGEELIQFLRTKTKENLETIVKKITE